MDENRRRQVLCLDRLFQSFHGPSTRRLAHTAARMLKAEEPRKPTSRNFTAVAALERADFLHAQGSMLEGILWLWFGTKKGFLPESEARSSLMQIGATVQSREGIDARVVSLFPVKSQLALNDFLTSNRDSQQKISAASSIDDQSFITLQSALSLEMSFASDWVAQSLVIAISFGTDASWDTLIKSDYRPNAFVEALKLQATEPSSIDIHTVQAGFFRACAHMAEMQLLLDRFSSLSALPRDLMVELKEICFWRMNFIVGSARERFEKIAEMVGTRLIDEVRGGHRDRATAVPDQKAFATHVKRLMDEWSEGIVMFKARSA